MKGKCTPESMETPEMEAKSHPKGFLMKATSLSEKKLGHGKKEHKGKDHLKAKKR
jgi:hypothetical protein